MVLTYDLLEDRCTIDVISRRKKIFFFKMAANFETLENILPDWANEEIEITLVEAVDKFQKEEEEKTRFYVENDFWSNLSRSRQNETQNGS